MLANPTLFDLADGTPDQKAIKAWSLAAKVKKTEFALKYAIYETGWVTPGYILDGVKWLAEGDIPTSDSRSDLTVERTA